MSRNGTIRRTFRLPPAASDELAELQTKLEYCLTMTDVVRYCIHDTWCRTFQNGGPLFESDLEKTAGRIAEGVQCGANVEASAKRNNPDGKAAGKAKRLAAEKPSGANKTARRGSGGRPGKGRVK